MQDGWPSPAIAEEYEQLAAGLLGERALDVTWELLGGDEVGDRLVTVIEHRLPTGRHVRWKLSYDSHELCAATIGTAEQPEAVTWEPGPRRDFGALRWPAHWVRRSPGSEDMVVEIEAVHGALPAATATEAAS
jgi:hypothetical protein